MLSQIETGRAGGYVVVVVKCNDHMSPQPQLDFGM